jgi:NADPH-ferrihemoprotein reductase
MFLFYGCRKEDEDYLYRDEWPEYQRGLGGKLNLHVAVSRSERRKPDGSESTIPMLKWYMDVG